MAHGNHRQMAWLSRRGFLKSALAAGAAGVAFPAILPAGARAQQTTGEPIRIGVIGCGRIARSRHFPAVLKYPEQARIVAVSDVDSVRLKDAKELLETRYAEKLGEPATIRTVADYQEILAADDIDAVIICTPDHWHAQPVIEAALAGKDIYVEKPSSLTIAEGRQMADVIARTGRIVQVGSQWRSNPSFRQACELVRNGRLGRLSQIVIGVTADPAGGNPDPMPVPAHLDYDRWLGSTPVVPYTEDRVHPQSDDLRVRYGRPGWLRCEQFGAGMITGWGTHELDTAHWAMGTELGGPVDVLATAEFPTEGLWDVHTAFHVEARYPNGVIVSMSDKNPVGYRFIGENGWLQLTRGRGPMLAASDPAILEPLGEGAQRLHASPQNDHHLDWFESIRTRKPPVAPMEEGHRSCSACLVAHISMKLGRRVQWDPATEKFVNDPEADAMIARPQRAPYGTDAVMARLG